MLMMTFVVESNHAVTTSVDVIFRISSHNCGCLRLLRLHNVVKSEAAARNGTSSERRREVLHRTASAPQ